MLKKFRKEAMIYGIPVKTNNIDTNKNQFNIDG